MLSQCKDRKSLLKLVNKEITFDQFVTKHNCDNEGLKYSCKDDLLQKGINPSFFENLDEIEHQMKTIFGVKSIKDIDPDEVANNGKKNALMA